MKLAILICLAACGDNRTLEPGVDGGPPDMEVTPPPPPGITFFDFAIAVDVSPDGKLAVFEAFEGLTAVAMYHDTITGETTRATELGDPGRVLATGVSNTGALSALHGEPVEAGLWTAATDWQDLGSPHAAGCDQDISAGFDVSADGAVVVGLAWNNCVPDAFRWSAGTFTTLQVLGTGFATAPTNRATVISDDGKVAAGFAQNGAIDRSPAVWNADGTGIMLVPDNHDAPGEVLSISADGHVVAGQLGGEGFVWSAGVMTPIPRPEISLPSDFVFPNAMSGDGNVVLGGVGDAFFTIPVAFAWTPDAGTRTLADLVAAAGIAVPEGTLFNSVLGASADATVLAGTAMDRDGKPLTFALRLPPGAFAAP